MAEKKTKKVAAKTLAKDGTSPAKKKAAAKVLASEKPNQAVAEATLQAAHARGRDLVETAKGVDIPDVLDDATEFVADGTEAVANQLTHVAKATRRISGRDISLVLVGFGVGTVVGGYVGFRVAEKKMRVRFDELLAEETAHVREHYQQKLVAHDAEAHKPSIEDLAAFDVVTQDKAEGIVAEMGYVSPQEQSATISAKTPAQIMRETPETEEMRHVAEAGRALVSEIEGGSDRSAERAQFVRETKNIFAERDAAMPMWDYAVEIKHRDLRFPYVVHVDEYRENPGEHEQIDLMWYEGDGVLTAENDRIIDDAEEAVGLDNLNRFGHGGADANSVHIRNEVREIDYEVIRSHGSYALEVAGFDPDDTGLRHSDKSWRGRQDFSDDD